jgi:hypothetical protein
VPFSGVRVFTQSRKQVSLPVGLLSPEADDFGAISAALTVCDRFSREVFLRSG